MRGYGVDSYEQIYGPLIHAQPFISIRLIVVLPAIEGARLGNRRIKLLI